MSDKTKLIKTIYLYLVSIIGLMMIVIPTGSLINLGLKTWVFTKADLSYYEIAKPLGCGDTAPREVSDSVKTAPLSDEECTKLEEKNKKNEQERREANRQRDLASNLAFLIVGIPLFSYHWYLARKKE